MPDFKAFLDALKDDLLTLGQNELQEHAAALMQDGEDFAKSLQADLPKWGKQLADGKMSAAAFKLAVGGKQDLLKMEALKQAGLAAIRVDKLKQSILNTIVGTATKVFIP